MTEASYVVLLSRACPGLFSLDEILHRVPLAFGYALIHAGRLYDGEPMIWPQVHLSKRGRWWQRVTDFIRRRPQD